jgi:hypothetical protein
MMNEQPTKDSNYSDMYPHYMPSEQVTLDSLVFCHYNYDSQYHGLHLPSQ